jgi:hypothetical protein
MTIFSDKTVMPGSCDDDTVTRSILADAIKQSQHSRDEIADRMSVLLGSKLSVAMLNNFTSESKDRHRWPFAWTRAFCMATEDMRLVQHLAEQTGFILLPQADADIVRLGELVVEQRRNEEEIANRAKNVIERRDRQ